MKSAGIEKLKGNVVTVFCGNYIYTGKLTSVTKSAIILQDAGIVYETGDFDNPEWKDIQKMNCDWHISRHAIESFGLMKKVEPKEK